MFFSKRIVNCIDHFTRNEQLKCAHSNLNALFLERLHHGTFYF